MFDSFTWKCQCRTLLVENMKERTIIAQSIVYDAIKNEGGIQEIQITKKMLDFVRGARNRYSDYLDDKKLEKNEEERKKAEKIKLEQQVKQLEEKRN